MEFPFTGAYIGGATGFRNDANIPCIHRMISNMMSEVVSKYYDQECSVAEMEILRRDVCALKDKFVNTFSTVCTSGLFKLTFYFFEHSIEDNSRFWGLSALDMSLYKLYSTNVRAVYCYTSQRIATRMYKTGSDQNQLQIMDPGRHLLEENVLLEGFVMERHYA